MNSVKQHSILVILPYFGPLPPMFGHWLRSAELNETVDFLIVTNQELHSSASNITVRKTSLQQIKEKAIEALGTYVALESPYKLCDLKPFYGKIFANDVCGYDFWGYCDCDLVFGDIRAFLTEDILGTYNSILGLGHLHLQRTNDPLYQDVIEHCKSRDGMSWKEVVALNRNVGFDEMPFGVTAAYYRTHPNLSWTGYTPTDKCFLDVTHTQPLFRDSYDDYRLYVNSFYNRMSDRYPCWKRIPTAIPKHVIVLKDSVKLYTFSLVDGQVHRKEIIYAHIKRRRINSDYSNTEHYMIVPNKIIPEHTVSKFFLLLNTLRPAPHITYWSQYIQSKFARLKEKIFSR